MTTNKSDHDFPSFYAECAFTDGRCDARDGTDSTGSYTRHGQPEAVGMEWYQRGVAAHQAQEISA